MRGIFLVIDGKPEGPLTDAQVRDSLAQGGIPADTLAWHEGLDGWVAVEKILGAETPPEFKPADTSAPALVQVENV